MKNREQLDAENSPRVHIVDVGARSGVSKRWNRFADRIRVTGFEPDIAECDRLNAQTLPFDARFLPHALGRTDQQQRLLHVTRSPGSSSLYPPNRAVLDRFEYGESISVVKTSPVVTRRMDAVISDPPDVLKIDTQGTELEILEGAGALLDSTIAVELEVEFIQIYEDQPLFADVDRFMRSKGFSLRSLRRDLWREKGASRHPWGGQLVHGDVLYLRRALLDSPKGHLILAAYHQYDLVEKMGRSDLIPHTHWLIRGVSRILSGYPHRETRRFVDRFRDVNGTDWHDPDFF